MQPSAFLVNTSRGDAIDEAALADLLSRRHIAGAGLDVYADEPHIPQPGDYRMWCCCRILVSND